MKLSPLPRDECTRLCRHESGHALCYLTEKNEEPIINFGIGGIDEELRVLLCVLADKVDEILAGMESAPTGEDSLYEPQPSFVTVLRRMCDIVYPRDESFVLINTNDDRKAAIRIRLAGPAAVQTHSAVERSKLVNFFAFGAMRNTDLTQPYWHINSLLQEEYDCDPTHEMLLTVANCIYGKIHQTLLDTEYIGALDVIHKHFEQWGFIENIRSLTYRTLLNNAEFILPIQQLFTANPEHTIENVQHHYNRYRENVTGKLLDTLEKQGYPMKRLQEMGEVLRETVDIEGILEKAATLSNPEEIYD